MGLRVETFASAQEFLAAKRPGRSGLFDTRRANAGHQRPRSATQVERSEYPDSHHFYYRSWRYSHVRARDERRGARVSDQARARTGPAGRRAKSNCQRPGTAEGARGNSVTIRARFDSLTPREKEVLDLVVAGLLNKQIADELGPAS